MPMIVSISTILDAVVANVLTNYIVREWTEFL
jgi:hypothetical protein